MKHYALSDWVDFARNTSEQERVDAMQKHLNSGCTKCGRTVDLWKRVADFGSQENAYEPPKSVVQALKVAFSTCQLYGVQPAGIQIPGLLFDSSLQPALAGMRGTAATARQLIYKSGNFHIDMQVQPKPGSDAAVLVGQLLDSNEVSQGVGGILVSLVRGGQMVSRTRTNGFGEFDFGLGLSQSAQLVFGLAENRTIIVPVPGSAASDDNVVTKQ